MDALAAGYEDRAVANANQLPWIYRRTLILGLQIGVLVLKARIRWAAARD